MFRLQFFPVQTGHHRVSFYDQFRIIREASNLGHGAIDIGSREGTRIYAATDGQVVNRCVIGGDTVDGAGYREPSGNYVVIVDEQGYFYYYFHLYESPNVTPGQRVKSGQWIGLMGNSGLARRAGPGRTAPIHLHFQVVRHLHDRSGSRRWYETLEFPIANLYNRDPFPELKRLALELPGSSSGMGRGPGGVRLDSVIIRPVPAATASEGVHPHAGDRLPGPGSAEAPVAGEEGGT